MKTTYYLLIVALLMASCNRIEEKQESNMESRDIVMMTELKDDREAIKKYEYYHSAEGVWPEVVHAAEVSGIENIKIYRYANRLVMIITVPADADMDKVNRKYAESSDRLREWEAVMSELQQAPPGAQKGEIWVPMELIHNYENGRVR